MAKHTWIAIAASAVVGSLTGGLVVSLGASNPAPVHVVERVERAPERVVERTVVHSADAPAPAPVAVVEVGAGGGAASPPAELDDDSRVEAYAAYVTSEPRDAAWQAELAHSVTGALGADDDLAGTELVDVSCGSTVCELRLAHGNPGDREAFAQAAPLIEGLQAQGYVRFVDDGGPASIVYVARDGATLPEIL